MVLLDTLSNAAHLGETKADAPHNAGSMSTHAAGSALANFALLMAKGSAVRYVEILTCLYLDHGLDIPDFSKYLLIQPEPEEVECTHFEENVSLMAELDEYHSHNEDEYHNNNASLVVTAFTSDYYELCSTKAKDFEDWFDDGDVDWDVLNESIISERKNTIYELESSPPILCRRQRFPNGIRSNLLVHHNNILFDLTIDNIPDQLIDNVINQAEALNEVNCLPQVVLDVTSDDCDDTLQQLIDNLESLIENNTPDSSKDDINTTELPKYDNNTLSPIFESNPVESTKCYDITTNTEFQNTPTAPETKITYKQPRTPQRLQPHSVFGRQIPLRIYADYLDLTPRLPSRPALRCRPTTSVTAAGNKEKPDMMSVSQRLPLDESVVINCTDESISTDGRTPSPSPNANLEQTSVCAPNSHAGQMNDFIGFSKQEICETPNKMKLNLLMGGK